MGRYPTGHYVFRKGHLRCGSCGEAMVPTTRERAHEAYVCYRRMRLGMAACPQAPVRRHAIDTAVWQFFERVALDVDATKQAVTERSTAKLTEIDALREQATLEVGRAQDRLSRVRRDYQDGKLDADDWREQRVELTADLEAAAAHVERLEAQRQAALDEVRQVDAESAVLRELTALRALIVGEARDGRREGLERLPGHTPPPVRPLRS